MTPNPQEAIALVTGGSRGIGRAICERLASDGYTVVINYVARQDAAEETLRLIESSGGRGWICRADVCNADEVAAMFAQIRQRHGRLDVLVNNAGRTYSGLFALTPPAKFFEIIEANLKGAVLCSQAAIRLMLPRKSGAIINISSRSGAQPQVGLTAYSASKAALTNLTRGLAREMVSRGIRINGVAPAWTDTDMLDAATRATLDAAASRIALGRIARADEVAAAVSALLRPDLTYLVGQTLELDGGGTI
ncbi:MAG: SDR family NAD(P)-dependent oxidoreductase [Candidatus Solibacter sp.]|jgi:3-oxoacyl-[acyl-carrier protein] reductase